MHREAKVGQQYGVTLFHAGFGTTAARKCLSRAASRFGSPTYYCSVAVPRDGATVTSAPYDFARMAGAEANHMVALRRQLHARPELSHQEIETTRLVVTELEALGLHVQTEEGRPGAIATMDWGLAGPYIAVRADLDALPLQEVGNPPYRSTRPGVMHACGHDGHTALMIGVARVLRRLGPLPGSVRFIFQPAEEDAPQGGARQMLARGALDGVARILGVHLWPDLPVGTIGLRPGPLMAASDPFRITVEGHAAHAAAPHEGTDALTITAQVLHSVQALVAQRIDPRQPAVITVGTIRGGARYNVVCDHVELAGTIRTLDESTRGQVHERLRATAVGVAEALGARATVEIAPGYPVLVNDAETVGQVRHAARAVWGDQAIVDLDLPALQSEDFGFYLHERPGAFVFLGCRNESRGLVHTLHSPAFDFDEAALSVGAAVVAAWCCHNLIGEGAAPTS